MFRVRLSLLCAFALLALCASVAVAQKFRVSQQRQADVHNPFSSNYLPLQPNQPIKQGPRLRSNVSSSGFGRIYPYGFLPLGYYDPYGDYGGYGGGWYGGSCHPGYFVLSPDTLYGPRPVGNLLGLNASRTTYDEPLYAEPERERPSRTSNVQAKAQAGKFIEYGDAMFRTQKYSRALQRYRTAANIAPDLPDTMLRQGFTLLALGRYAEAAKALRRALPLRASWNGGEMPLKELYAGDEIAKTSHRETLAQAVEGNRFDADLLFLLAMHLYFDGQADRAHPFLTRSAQLGGNSDRALNRLALWQSDLAGTKGSKRVEF